MHSILWGGAFFKIRLFSQALRCFNRMLEANSLDLVLSETLFRTVVELSRARALVRCHFLRVLERAAIGEIGGNAGRPERMAANRLGNARHGGTAPNHAPGIGLAHRLVG